LAVFVLVGLHISHAAVQIANTEIYIYNDPNVNGLLKARLDYYYGGTQTSVDNKYALTFDYFNSVELIKTIVVDEGNGVTTPKKVRYFKCPNCEGETFEKPFPVLSTSGMTAGSNVNLRLGPGNYQDCKKYTASVTKPEEVAELYVLVSDTTKVCRAIFSNGKTWDFNGNFVSIDTSKLLHDGCPTPKCTRIVDVCLVLDNSGSVTSNGFKNERNWATAFANSLEFGPARLAVTSFTKEGISHFDFTDNQYNALQKISQISFLDGSATCISCGMNLCTSFFKNRDASRNQVDQLMIVLTDGKNNWPRNSDSDTTTPYNALVAAVNAAETQGIEKVAVGVGSDPRDSDLNLIADIIPGLFADPNAPAVLKVTGFDTLSQTIPKLIQATCSELSGNPCGVNCGGFCKCGQCLCPQTSAGGLCDDGNKCTGYKCTISSGGSAGCILDTTFKCSDGDKCTVDKCNIDTGCDFEEKVNCDFGKSCKVYSCDASLGCQETTRNCRDNDACTEDSCVEPGGCQNEKKNCSLCELNEGGIKVQKQCPEAGSPDIGNLCKLYYCDLATGNCEFNPLNCDDGNECTDDSCDPATGCVYTVHDCNDALSCTIDTCDRVLGCVHVSLNASHCNDYNECTIDSMNNNTEGCCVHENRTCEDSGDVCFPTACGVSTGCKVKKRDCVSEIGVDNLGDCKLALCNASQGGCFSEIIEGKKVDDCGYCDGTRECILSVPQIIGLTAGILAAIILGVIVAVLVMGAISGKIAMNYYRKYQGKMDNLKNNPLYENNGQKDNPLYDAAKE
jgi:hypothetical protein